MPRLGTPKLRSVSERRRQRGFVDGTTLALFAVGVLAALALFASEEASATASLQQARRLSLLSSANRDLVLAHLWFEEWVAGDATINLERDVDATLDASIDGISAVLDGRVERGVGALPLSLEPLRKELEVLRGELRELLEMTRSRAKDRLGEGQIGGQAD